MKLIILSIYLSVSLLVSLAITTLPPWAFGQPEGRVRNLNTNAIFETIQEAINAANSGDTIHVGNGTYYEHVVVNKTITLLGENKTDTIIDGKGSGNIIFVVADNVKISGFTLQNSERTTIYAGSGIYLNDTKNSIISDNILRENVYGIQVHYSSDNSISGNIIIDNLFGIGITYATGNTFSRNNISQNSNGIWLSYSTDNFFYGNNISLSTYSAIEINACDNNIFSFNSVSHNLYGFNLKISTSNKFSENNVSDNEQGFLLVISFYNRINRNNISSNIYGVILSSSRDNIILNNRLINNQNSMQLTTSNNNLLYHNNFINTLANTTQQPFCIGSMNSWDNGIEGNYWSSHIGPDGNKDGIADKKYVINGENVDNYPLMADFTEFSVIVGTRSYIVDVISSSTLSMLEYLYYPANRTAVISFLVVNAGGRAFCRICIPETLIASPVMVVLNNNVSISSEIVYNNKTHNWFYFAYNLPQNNEPVTILLFSQEQTAMWQLWFWAAMALAAIVMIQFLFITKYRQVSNEQRETICAYELKLQSYAREHFNTARRLFTIDVQRRKVQIEKFERKYNVKIRPSNSFEGMLRSMEPKERKKQGKTDV